MGTPLVLRCVVASIPKMGHSPSENEDAAAFDLDRMRFAVADGATEGWESGAWSRHLAEHYLRRSPSPTDFADWLGAIRADWQPPGASGLAAWYTELKEEQGSFSTLLGLEFRKSRERTGLAWKAVSVGDSCLFIWRGNRFEVTFPCTSASDFGHRPSLVPSSADRACPEPSWLAGWVEPADLYILATDAIARLLLEANPHPLIKVMEEAVANSRPDPLESALGGLQNELNDDATVIAVLASEQTENRSRTGR